MNLITCCYNVTLIQQSDPGDSDSMSMWPKYTTPGSSKDTTNPPSNLLSGEDKDLTPSVLDCPPTVHTASLAPSNPDFIAFIISFKDLSRTIFYSISSNQNQNPFSGIHQFCLILPRWLASGRFIFPFPILLNISDSFPIIIYHETNAFPQVSRGYRQHVAPIHNGSNTSVLPAGNWGNYFHLIQWLLVYRFLSNAGHHSNYDESSSRGTLVPLQSST